MKKFFKLTKSKRIIILLSTLLSVLMAIILGSAFYVTKSENVKKSIEYGGGAEYVVKVEPNNKSQNASDIAADVAEEIYNRLDPLGIAGASADSEISGNNASVRVSYPGVTSSSDKREIEKLIVDKPQLVLADVYGNPLFDKHGLFNRHVYSRGKDPKGFVGLYGESLESFYHYDLTKDSDATINSPLSTRVPIASGGAKVQMQMQGSRIVRIDLENGQDVSIEWTKATKYISQLPKGANRIIAWLDPQKFLAKMNEFDKSFWQNAKGSLISLAFVNESPKKGTLRSHVIDSKQYYISDATVDKPLSGNSFIIKGSFTPQRAQNLARQINYGVSNYKLKIISSRAVDAGYGASAFDRALIAGAVVFFVIALILIINYGLLGALATISIALFLFATLTFFSLMNAQYSPASIAALVIGIGMSVDAVIIMFERLKSESYKGATMQTAFKTSSKKSWTTIMDSNITTLIVAVVLFYFGTRSIIGLSVTLMLSIVFTLIIMLYFTKFTASMLIKSALFADKPFLAGLKPKFDNGVQNKINKFNFMKNTKWFTIASVIILFSGVVVFIVFATIGNSFGSGFNLSQEFVGGTSLTIQAHDGYTLPARSVINDSINSSGLSHHDIIGISDTQLTLSTDSQYTDLSAIKTSLVGTFSHSDVYLSNTATNVAHKLVIDAITAVCIAMALIIVYTLIRFRWTYSIAALVALLHDALIVVAFFAITRIKIEPIFIAAVLSVIGYSINDTIVTFDRVREKTRTHVGELNKESISDIANIAIKETLKRSLWTSATTILAIIILMSFGNATKWSFNVAMLIGLVSGTYSSIFIATWLWTKLELIRQNKIKKRKAKGFWDVKGIEEQTIVGINDIKI